MADHITSINGGVVHLCVPGAKGVPACNPQSVYSRRASPLIRTSKAVTCKKCLKLEAKNEQVAGDDPAIEPDKQGDPRVEKLTAEADDLLRIEDEAAREAVERFRGQLGQLVEQVSAAWVKLYGDANAQPSKISTELLNSTLVRLRAAQHALVPRARTAIQAGVEAGARQGVEVATDAFPREFDVESIAARALTGIGGDEDVVSGLVSAGRKRATALLVPSYATTLLKTLLAIATGGERTASEVERAARTAVNRAATAGAVAVAETNGVGLLWVAERDACVHCLAYAGQTVKPGKLFPNDLTYGDKPLSQPDDRSKGLAGPPLHPNCRCTVRPFDPQWDADLPRALEREARRSVALGFKLESEPSAVRLRAADRLLKAGAGLPKTVEARAKAAVKQGKFADRRRPANR